MPVPEPLHDLPAGSLDVEHARLLTVEQHDPTARRPRGSKLRLKGHWLTAAGFAPGTTAAVSVLPGRIVITPRRVT